jgi:hypothetical protein
VVAKPNNGLCPRSRAIRITTRFTPQDRPAFIRNLSRERRIDPDKALIDKLLDLCVT